MTEQYFKSIKELPTESWFVHGERSCQGCGEALATKIIMKAIGPSTIVVSATGCLEIISSPYPYTSWAVPWAHFLFENAAASASGIETGLRVLMRKGRLPKKKINVTVFAGDGGTVDIGLQSLSGALERGHDFLYVCLDNEAYMNTGIQRSSSTPYAAWTTTSAVGKVIRGKPQWKKDIVSIVDAHRVPYIATACPTYPLDLANKAKRGVEVEGPAYLHVFCPCPPGWRYPSEKSILVGRLGVETGIFPLYEIEDGELGLTVNVPQRKHVREYLKIQGRFTHLNEEEIAKIQKRVDEESEKLGLGPRVKS